MIETSGLTKWWGTIAGLALVSYLMEKATIARVRARVVSLEYQE
jgi:hypothetical protein